MQEVLPQLPEAHSPDREAATPGRQQKAACNKSPHQKRGSKKLALIADGQKLHTEEKPYKCTECGKGFKGCSRLMNHLQTHTREKTFECVECGKSFSRKANLVVHQRIHTGERPYKCKECEKTFSRTSNLIAHRKTHVKKKSFSCTMCRKSFSRSTALLQHQRAHMDGKPYRCTECGNSFHLCSNFVKHQRIHLRERPSEHTAGNWIKICWVLFQAVQTHRECYIRYCGLHLFLNNSSSLLWIWVGLFCLVVFFPSYIIFLSLSFEEVPWKC